MSLAFVWSVDSGDTRTPGSSDGVSCIAAPVGEAMALSVPHQPLLLPLHATQKRKKKKKL